MSKLLGCLLLATLTTAPALADANRDRDSSALRDDDCAKQRKRGKTCELTIEGEEVKGGVPTAGESRIDVINIGKAASLIRLRRDFITEILKTAEDL